MRNDWNTVFDLHDRRLWERQSNMGDEGFQFMPNTTSSVINDLKFAVEKSTRSTFTILSGVNIAAGLILALLIFWDSYVAARRNAYVFSLRSSFFNAIGPAEVFPFVLSWGIVGQGIIFLVAQLKGLEGLLVLGCTYVSQAMLPGLFIVPFIQLVFALHTTIQALRPQPFRRSPRWATPVCLLIIFVGLMSSYAVARVNRPPDFCYASLFWFVSTWRLACFGILTGIASILLTGAIVIFIRLNQTVSVGTVERMTASRMVYFMVLGAILNALVAPFFYSISFDNPLALTNTQNQLAMAASVMANISGLVFGLLYLLLRTSMIRSIGARAPLQLDGPQQKKSAHAWSPGAEIYNTHIEQPVSPARLFQSRASMRRSVATAKSSIYSTDESVVPALPSKIGSHEADMVQVTTAAVVTPQKIHTRKESYSLFPNQRDTPTFKTNTSLPAPAFAASTKSMQSEKLLDEELLPPPRIRVPGVSRLERDSSQLSSATLQFALRLSNLVSAVIPSTPTMLGSNRSSSTGRASPLDPSLMVQPLSLAQSLRASRFSSTALKNGSNDSLALPFFLQTEARDYAKTYEVEDNTPMILSPTVYEPEAKKTQQASGKHKKNPSNGSASGSYFQSGDSYKVETQDWI